MKRGHILRFGMHENNYIIDAIHLLHSDEMVYQPRSRCTVQGDSTDSSALRPTYEFGFIFIVL